MNTSFSETNIDSAQAKNFTQKIKQWATELGFHGCGITNTDLGDEEIQLMNWLEKGFHGDMDYMERHGTLRSRPSELLPKTVSIISVRMEYLPPNTSDEWGILKSPEKAYVSRYALGRDYHKVMRQRLQKLATRIQDEIGNYSYRAFVDSAPVLETSLAAKAGLGWKGKHSLMINRDTGSWFFLGELFTSLNLAEDSKQKNHCGSCSACIEICPTKAIVSPYTVDARRCISYLTIENKGPIPEEFRSAIGNRIYGCDDCQLICPWNRFAERTEVDDYRVRNQLDDIALTELAYWTEEEFLQKLEGNPIRRIGHEAWLRNISVALGNGLSTDKTYTALKHLLEHPSSLVREHVIWAMDQHLPLSAS